MLYVECWTCDGWGRNPCPRCVDRNGLAYMCLSRTLKQADPDCGDCGGSGAVECEGCEGDGNVWAKEE
jgi:hypothetical protein